MAKRKPMTEQQLVGVVDSYVREAIGFIGGELSEQRRLAMSYYLSQPFGDEEDGRSHYISSDVQDTIEWMLPNLLEPFVAGDKVVQFNPNGAEDVEAAEQETAMVNHVVMQDNDGFEVLYSWFKDALLSKNGIAKAWAEQHELVNDETYEGLTEMQVVMLAEDPEMQVTAATSGLDPATGMTTYDVTVRRTRQKKRIRIAAVPPEQFLISRRAISIDDAPFCAHRILKTESDLILEGYDPKVVRGLPTYDEGEYNDERFQRFSFDDEYPTLEMGAGTDHGPSRQIWVNECYVRLDYDGDGIAELRQVIVAGSENSTVLSNELWPHERPPFYSICPVPVTHKFYGMSIADLTMDIQQIRSVLSRQMLDATYLSNNPRVAVLDGEVNLDDFLTYRPGGMVRTKTPPSQAILPITTPPPDQTTFNMLEFMTGERESRTGITKYGQGLDSATLNDTASGINQLMTAAQMRVKLIARLFAETGVSKLFIGVHELVRKYQDVPRTIRIKNSWTEINPTDWSERIDTTVEVGLGSGNREIQLMHLDSLAQAQAGIIQMQGGIDGPLVHGRHVFNLMEKKAELAGFKMPDLFVADPDDPNNQAQPKQEQPDPALVKLQSDVQIAQQKLQAEMQEAQAKLAADAQEMQAKIQLEYEKMAQAKQEHEDEMALKWAELGAEQEKHGIDAVTKRAELATKEAAAYERAVDVERIRGDNARFTAEQKQFERDNPPPPPTPTVKSVEVVRGPDGKIAGANVFEGPADG